MAGNKIRIDGDFSGFLRGMGKVNSELKKMGKGTTIQLDDKEMKKFKNFNIGVWRDLTKDVDKYSAKLERLNKLKINGSLSQVQLNQEKALNALIEKRTAEIKKQQDMFKNGNWLQKRGARMQAGAKPGSGMDMMGGMMGGLGNAVSAMGPAGMVIGAGVGAYMGARALAGPRRQLADENLKFMGLSRRTVSRDNLAELRQAGVESGYNAQESMQAANDLQRNAGNVNSRHELQNLFNISRMTGMGNDEVGGYASTFRNTAVDSKGADLQGNLEKTRDLYKQAIISALDTSGALKFMQTTAEMVDQIANEGSADVESIKSTLTNLALNNEFYKANASRGEAAMKGGEGFFKSGEGTGLAMRAIGSLGMSSGLSGPELLAMQRKGFTEKGGVGAQGLMAITKQMASASAGLTPENFGKSSGAARATGALAISQQFGISQTNAEELLKTAMTGGTKSEKEINDMFLSDSEKQVNLQNSMDMNIKKNEAHLTEMMMKIGEVIAPALVSMEGMLWKLTDHITGDAGKKSTRVLDLEAQGATKKASEERGSLWDTTKRMFGGGADKEAQEALQALASSKTKEGMGLNFAESNSYVQGANTEGIQDLAKKGMLGGTENSWKQSRYDQIKSSYDELKTNYDKQMTDAESIQDPALKRKAIAQTTDERESLNELAAAINLLVGYLGKQPVAKLPGQR